MAGQALMFDRDLRDLHELPPMCGGTAPAALADEAVHDAWLSAHRDRTTPTPLSLSLSLTLF